VPEEVVAVGRSIGEASPMLSDLGQVLLESLIRDELSIYGELFLL